MTRDEIISEAMNASEEIHMTAEYENGFINGAEWAQQALIDKACEWLYKNLTINCKKGECETIEEFRKAMEE